MYMQKVVVILCPQQLPGVAGLGRLVWSQVELSGCKHATLRAMP